MYDYLNFKKLDLHDCRVYSWGIIPEENKLLMDVDWIHSRELINDKYHLFISPATFIFSNVWDIDMDITMNMFLIIDNMEIVSVQKPRNISVLPKESNEYTCRINFMEGCITFRTIDFSIIQRKKEIIASNTYFSYDEREGISLSTEGNVFRVDLK